MLILGVLLAEGCISLLVFIMWNNSVKLAPYSPYPVLQWPNHTYPHGLFRMFVIFRYFILSAFHQCIVFAFARLDLVIRCATVLFVASEFHQIEFVELLQQYLCFMYGCRGIQPSKLLSSTAVRWSAILSSSLDVRCSAYSDML